MSYRTILVHLDLSPSAPERIRLAAELALREQAHLVGLATCGIPRFLYTGDPFDASGAALAECIALSEQRAAQAVASFRQVTAAAGLASAESRTAQQDEYASLCLHARYADLVVLGQSGPAGGEDQLLGTLAQHTVLHCGRPVLVVPRSGQFPTLGERPLVAWNASHQAASAVAAALPLLRRAGQATVAIFGPVLAQDAHGAEPGADIAQYLARHGVQVEVQRFPAEENSGAALLALAAATGADLLVMGAYRHSPLRELLLGGVTRFMLGHADLPILMRH